MRTIISPAVAAVCLMCLGCIWDAQYQWHPGANWSNLTVGQTAIVGGLAVTAILTIGFYLGGGGDR